MIFWAMNSLCWRLIKWSNYFLMSQVPQRAIKSIIIYYLIHSPFNINRETDDSIYLRTILDLSRSFHGLGWINKRQLGCFFFLTVKSRRGFLPDCDSSIHVERWISYLRVSRDGSTLSDGCRALRRRHYIHKGVAVSVILRVDGCK